MSNWRTEPYKSIFIPPTLFVVHRKVLENDDWQMVMSSYLAIVARILILDQMVFIQVLQDLNVEAPFDKILDIWIKKMPLIGHPDKRKLLALALASLFTVQNDTIYQRFDVLLQCVCEALNDIMVQDKDDPSVFVE